MRKLYLMILALTLSLAMLAAAVAPVMAEQPAEDGGNVPVAWMSFAGSNSRVKDDSGQAQLSFLVKKLGDGTTVGHMWHKERVTGVYTSYDILGSYFRETDGVKVAEIFTSNPHSGQYGNFTVYSWWIFTDGGEPGATRDRFKLYSYYVPVGLPLVPTFSPPGPPPTVVPPTWPGWWRFIDQDWIPGGNIQIHITKNYEN